jgi:hypothetical protein
MISGGRSRLPVALIKPLIEEIDRRWKRGHQGKVTLRVIGSSALMLQTKYVRGTKDGDVLETHGITAEVKGQLLELAGDGTDLHKRFGIYLDVVVGALPMLPQTPLFHPVSGLSSLKHFKAECLDVVDVVVSKLRRFNVNDDADIRAMVELGLLPHKRLVNRFEKAMDRFTLDARAEDLPKIIKNLHRVERDYLGVEPSEIELPSWLE